MPTSAFLAHSGLWNVNDSIVGKAKLSTLLYDRVTVSGSMTPNHFVEKAAHRQGEPKLNHKAKKALATCWAGAPSHTPQFEFNGRKADARLAAGPPALALATTATLLEFRCSPREDGETEALYDYTILEVLYWRKYFSEATFIGHDITEEVLRRFAAPLITVDTREASAECPDVLSLSWNDIFSLRSSPFLQSYRAKYDELRAIGDTASMLDHYRSGLERLADAVRPNARRALGLAVLSNLPIPVVNPFHVGLSIYEVWHEAQLAKQYGWVMFIREAKHLAASAVRR